MIKRLPGGIASNKPKVKHAPMSLTTGGNNTKPNPHHKGVEGKNEKAAAKALAIRGV